MMMIKVDSVILIGKELTFQYSRRHHIDCRRIRLVIYSQFQYILLQFHLLRHYAYFGISLLLNNIMN